MKLPLEGITVVEFCQYLAGPWAGLRLADFGARVIKVERPGSGDACRQLATKNIRIDGDSLVFHTINRGKESFAANLKDPSHVEDVKQLLARADVLTHNFRPGVMERLGLSYQDLKPINPSLIYASVTGYGTIGPWRDKPGQDLLAQSMSGITHLTGKANDPPVPMGLAVGDGICGLHLAQGILAAVIRRERTGHGATVEVSLLESLLDLQFEALTTYLNDEHRHPSRSSVCAGHPYQGAPYGVYRSADGYLAMAMGCLDDVAKALGLMDRTHDFAKLDAFRDADAIRTLLGSRIRTQTTQYWLDRLEPADIWCAPVYDYAQLRDHEGYGVLDIEQSVQRADAPAIKTLRCPIRIDGERLFSAQAAPRIGDSTEAIQMSLSRTFLPQEVSTDDSPTLPLEGLTVVDFSQFLSGPSASLRLADLGATVIKVERPGNGDICRDLYVSNVEIDDESTIFHAINRNKLGYAADLKDADGLASVHRLIRKADVVIHNFRPGVMDRLKLGYEHVKQIKPDIIYAGISGYGDQGPWAAKPGQDLLLQSISGLTWLSGNADDGPVPFGLAVIDIWAGSLLAKAVLSALIRRERQSKGSLLQVNMLEAALDFQIEPITTFLYDKQQPQRTATNNAHALLGAPYGVYTTADGHLALAMCDVIQLGTLLDCPALTRLTEPNQWFTQRDELKTVLSDHLKTRSTQEWLDVLEPADIWCAKVLNWDTLFQSAGFKVLDMIQTVQRGNGTVYQTTRCPIKIDGKAPYSSRGSCLIGEHNHVIETIYA